MLLNILRVLTDTQTSQPSRLIILNIFSASAIAIMSFYLNRRYVFRAKGVRNRMFIPFLFISLTAIFVIQSIVINFSLTNLDFLSEFSMKLAEDIPIVKNFSYNFYESNIAKVLATLASMVWNYTMYKKFIFSKKY